MHRIVDLHTHSKYSRATSPDMNLESLYVWGKRKGITVIGTGDFTHPLWLASIKEKFEPAEPGLFQLKSPLARTQDVILPESVRANPLRFILTAEISTIYSKGGRVRKVHTVIVLPSIAAVEKLNTALGRIGNLRADGRPILGMDCKELLRLTLETDPDMLFIPAHAWTPWFSIFGSRSGFDSLEEAFEELTPHVRAIETGLSSDPPMNWRLSNLDSITLVSNSDAHSPSKLGREANVLDCDLRYAEIVDAIRSGDRHMVGTIEFFPEEGKYHFDGHRDCKVVLAPEESMKLGNICPQCGRELTLGVEHRVDVLANRPLGFTPPRAKRVEYIVPLVELIAQAKGVKAASGRNVLKEYDRMIAALGDEFSILRTVAPERIRDAGFGRMGEMIAAMRQGKVERQPGYDGVYGRITILSDGASTTAQKQLGLF